MNSDCQLGFICLLSIYFIIVSLFIGSACKVNSDCRLGFMCLLSKISLFIVSLQVYMALHVK